jgi:hypothetical protein
MELCKNKFIKNVLRLIYDERLDDRENFIRLISLIFSSHCYNERRFLIEMLFMKATSLKHS